MWPFKGKKAFSQAQKRDEIYAHMLQAAQNNNPGHLSHWAISLSVEHSADPLMPSLLARAFDTLAEKNRNHALIFCINYMGQKQSQQAAIDAALRPSTLRIMSAFDVRLPEDASLLAMAAQKLSGCATTAEEETFALTRWADAMDTLIEKDITNYALGAANNACCTGDARLVAYASRVWSAALVKLAHTDEPTATQLARSFASKCTEFNAPVPARIKQMARTR